MKKNVMLTRLIKCLCLALSVLAVSAVCLCLCFYYDYTVINLTGLYEEPEDTLDVVILGASEAFIDYSAAYAYDLYGYTSYPYAWDAATGELYEEQVREILKRQDPKWILVEINGILYDDPKDSTNENSLRMFLDHTPMSMNKVRTIVEHTPAQDWPRYFFPLAKYHGNWKIAWDQGGRIRDLLSLKRNGSLMKGNVTNVMPFDAPLSMDVTRDDSAEPLEPQSEAYLISFLEFCRENHLDNVIFVRFPHIIASDWNYHRFRRCNEAERIITQYGFDFINLERDNAQLGLDWSGDFYNDDHLNYVGQQKLTACLGKILVEQYGVEKSDLTLLQQKNWEMAAEYSHRFYDFCEEAMEAGNYDVYYETRWLLEQLAARTS